MSLTSSWFRQSVPTVAVCANSPVPPSAFHSSSTSVSSPGAKVASLNLPTVHLQVLVLNQIRAFASPTFLKTNLCDRFVPFIIIPKSRSAPLTTSTFPDFVEASCRMAAWMASFWDVIPTASLFPMAFAILETRRSCWIFAMTYPTPMHDKIRRRVRIGKRG